MRLIKNITPNVQKALDSAAQQILNEEADIQAKEFEIVS